MTKLSTNFQRKLQLHLFPLHHYSSTNRTKWIGCHTHNDLCSPVRECTKSRKAIKKKNYEGENDRSEGQMKRTKVIAKLAKNSFGNCQLVSICVCEGQEDNIIDVIELIKFSVHQNEWPILFARLFVVRYFRCECDFSWMNVYIEQWLGIFVVVIWWYIWE